jgi:hypothetical protein
MLKKILFVFITLIALIVGAALMQPTEYTVVRSAELPGQPLKYFEIVNDFQKWKLWSPWASLDSNMKVEISTPSSGVDATYFWSGNKDVGEGRMKILASENPKIIQMGLDFIKPFEATCITTFRFEEQNGNTLVTWTMAGTNNFLAKIFGLFMNMDKMIGKDFEKGLSTLGTL